MDEVVLENFAATVTDYYRRHGRHDLPWRLPEPDGAFDPYKILVSEIMLQQTQVPRVLPKFTSFLERFPSVAALAGASLKDVLIAWQGLGYNRRAKYLWQAAQLLTSDFGGTFPRTLQELTRLPGVGANTAGAILVYAFNLPAVFIETNIRAVYIYHFFKGQTDVPDKVILALLTRTLDRHDPREFYWSLMDYGTYLKQTVGNPNRASAGYTRQSKFAGSARQLRGKVLQLLAHRAMAKRELVTMLTDERLAAVLRDLEAEGMVSRCGDTYDLP